MSAHPIDGTTFFPRPTRRRVAASRHGAATPRSAGSPGGAASGRPAAQATHVRVLAPRGQDGFTLVELLVVVLMLVALVGIAVPTFVGQQDRAERAAVQSELRTAAIALESFRARNGFYSTEALDTSAFGFVRSVEVAVFYDPLDMTTDGFCVRAWYDPIQPGDTRDDSEVRADARAEWAITEAGMVFVATPDADRKCP